MRFSTLRGAISNGVPSLWKASWITCAVGSLAQGTTASVAKSGLKIRSESVRPSMKASSSSGYSPVMVCVNIEAGSVIGLPPKNFSRRHQLAARHARPGRG